MNSKRVQVEQGDVVFEQGPRTLRPGTPASLVTLDMVRLYNLWLNGELKGGECVCVMLRELLVVDQEPQPRGQNPVYAPPLRCSAESIYLLP